MRTSNLMSFFAVLFLLGICESYQKTIDNDELKLENTTRFFEIFILMNYPIDFKITSLRQLDMLVFAF